ncbi:NERD domain-containing protein [Desulfobacula phenolica]|uniref:Nuclease-related domain-containing protein n=1 Tax=Desulfobacula phenolica TaxID=90732 RepID=A0A1H2DM28_9BACT|nr:NERD domain-containing protein [Desulfobacula phenolica]SDT83963.1 Nuclease-related domain-containing protein [Desulfobacula phenolica]
MRMLPCQPYDTNSTAEIRVFEKFSQAPCLDPESVCFHSLNLPHHIKQRFGEADFVLLSAHGLFVFEVKGGSVSRDMEGLWHFTDKKGKDHVKRRSPFEQAQEALHSIKNDLKKQFGQDLIDRMCIGYGVIFPDCNLEVDTLEWDKTTLLNAKNFDFFDAWLNAFVHYWKSKDMRKTAAMLCDQDIDQIKTYLRPAFETLPALCAQLDTIHDRMCKLTKDQFCLLDVAQANKKIVCAGGAGTGKTFMAAELCRRFAQSCKNVLFVCKSLWLERYLHARLRQQNVTISTIDQLELKAKQSCIQYFDVLIVDEGQDLFNFKDLAKIESFLKGGFINGRWAVFHDTNHQSGVFGCYEKAALDYLLSMNPVCIPLKKNCRNTTPILKKIQSLTQYDTGTDGTGFGPDVVIHRCDTRPEILLAKELNRLVTMEGIPLGDITILSPFSFKDSCAARLNRSSRSKIQVLDENLIQNFYSNSKISYARIQDFKGLENRCIILIDLDHHYQDKKQLPLLYVGMSRATASLSLILSDRDHE